jgi:hypothetical protein
MSDKDKPVPSKESPASKGLTYIGAGAAIVDIPARDLTDTDLAELASALPEMFKTVYQQKIETPAALKAFLVKSGLYKEA